MFEQTDYGSYPGISVGTWLERNAPAMAKARSAVLPTETFARGTGVNTMFICAFCAWAATLPICRGKILGYSSIFGDVAPSQPKAISRKPSGKGKGGKKRAQGDGRWKGRGAAGLTRPSADSASPGATHLHDPLNPRSRQQMPVDVTRRQPGCSQPTSLHG